jgi:hypothetical protein
MARSVAISSDGGAGAVQTFTQLANIEPTGSRLWSRGILGFTAGFLSVWIFSNGVVAIFHAAGAAVPFAPWSMAPAPPFGIPMTLSASFWGGLWGVVYARLEPGLTSRLGWWPGGLVFGAVLPLLVLWSIVMPLKGLPVAGGFSFAAVTGDVVRHAAFGLGTAILFRILPRPNAEVPLTPPSAHGGAKQ